VAMNNMFAVLANTIMSDLGIFYCFILIKPHVLYNNLLLNVGTTEWGGGGKKYCKDHRRDMLDISHFVGVTLTKESVGLIKKCKRTQFVAGVESCRRTV
jgi:hypothetical protein